MAVITIIKKKVEHPLFYRWCDMRRRCTVVNRKDYMNYGGRGITVCNRWLDFNNFIEDMFPAFSPELSLERLDNNIGYSPENCVWATRIQQNNNTRKNRYITIGNETKTMAQWCILSKVKPSTVRQRFYVYGWDIKNALELENHNK